METENNNPHKNKVHKILAHSYLAYFILFLIGVFLNLIFSAQNESVLGEKFFTNPFMVLVGLLFLIFGTFLILWAQKTTRNFKKDVISKETFYRGPYCHTRSPTHLGLFFLMLGFGIIANAVFVILFTLISFIVTKLIFLEEEEKILAEKYGAPYLEYKKLVKF